MTEFCTLCTPTQYYMKIISLSLSISLLPHTETPDFNLTSIKFGQSSQNAHNRHGHVTGNVKKSWLNENAYGIWFHITIILFTKTFMQINYINFFVCRIFWRFYAGPVQALYARHFSTCRAKHIHTQCDPKMCKKLTQNHFNGAVIVV